MMNKHNKPTPVNGLILAGGLARRMDGQDKGLMILAGISLIERCINTLSPQVEQLFISANRNIAQYQKLTFPVLQDSTDKHEGPLAGLQRALEASPDMPVLVVPCDAPLFPAQLAARLWEAYQENDYLAAIPHDGTRLQPLFGLFSPTSLESLSQYLSTGQRKVETWVTSLPHKIVDFSDQSAHFLNINTTDDLHRAELFLERLKPC
ncbi:Molybdenum cofactor guanylyltransferase [hydrothermal vent metagenome]|uniref:Molybdenum cofactor guanylyltransferase n=1 Tax=hydrothermal vent metagenome TaxID=652676 RepID=A0A3B1A5J1_9ZZZZ